MKLFGALSCILVSALAVFLIVTNHATGSLVTDSKIIKNPASTGATTSGEQAEVIVINERTKNDGVPFPTCGIYSFNGPREVAEKKFRENNFAGAAKSFKDALEADPYDIRAQLGLGKSYAALRKYDDAITFLSKVRNECSRDRALTDPTNPSYDPNTMDTQSTALDMLPYQARESIDHEARLALENAVIATIRPSAPESASKDAFKNDRHFRVLNASLQLAKKHHAKSRLDELKAMYQLAQDNTRTLPADLVTECSTNARGTKEQWRDLTRLLVNSAVEEERDWYLDRVAIVSNGLSNADIEKAATYHCLVKNDFDAFYYGRFDSAQTIRTEINSHSPKYALLYANAAFDAGLRAFKTRSRYKAAKEFFQLALEIYSKSGTEKDIADTNYNLGMVSFSMDEIQEAKEFFKRAAGLRKGNDQLIAVLNFGTLAVDSILAPSPADGEYLSDLFKQTHHPEVAVLLGLYHLQQNDWEKAYAPFRAAVAAEYPDPPQLDSVIEDSFIAAKHQDRNLTDDQVLQEMFVRQDAIQYSICCRFSSASLDCANSLDNDEDYEISFGGSHGAHKLKTDMFPDFRETINTLFPTILRRTNRAHELPEFFQRAQRGLGYSLDTSGDLTYKETVAQALQNNWFCPPHTGVKQIIARVKINEDGDIEPSSLDMTEVTDSRIVGSICDETLRWTKLEKPAIDFYRGRELILVFNAANGIGPQSILGSSPYPEKVNTGEW